MQKNRRRGRIAIDVFHNQTHAEKQTQTRTYLEPIRNSLQKPIEGLPAALPSELYIVSLYKGAIDCSEHNSESPA